MAERLNTREIAFLKKLNSPEKIQDFLDTLGYNYCHDKYICRSPKELLKIPAEERKAHCLDGAIFAAAAQRINGRAPLIMEITMLDNNEHFIAPFQENGLWGAMAHSRTYTLRWRDPIHTSVRELALSYFQGCAFGGRLIIREYSQPIECSCFDDLNWMATKKSLEELGDRFDDYPHTRLFKPLTKIRPVPKELEALYTKHKE
jgi:hypothetical protein